MKLGYVHASVMQIDIHWEEIQDGRQCVELVYELDNMIS